MCDKCDTIKSRLDGYNSSLGSRIWSWVRNDKPISEMDIEHLRSRDCLQGSDKVVINEKL